MSFSLLLQFVTVHPLYHCRYRHQIKIVADPYDEYHCLFVPCHEEQMFDRIQRRKRERCLTRLNEARLSYPVDLKPKKAIHVIVYKCCCPRYPICWWEIPQDGEMFGNPKHL